MLSGTPTENLSFDRSSYADHNKVCIKDEKGNELSQEQIEELLKGTDRSLYRRWIPDNRRASGLFVYDIAIDLRTLFCVSLNAFEPEISEETAEKLISEGWVESKNVFGKCLVMPKAKRDEIIPVLAKALLNWRITSNQARTFSLLETLAVAVSDNANNLAAAIRSKMVEDGERTRVKPIVDENAGADVYVALPCAGYVVTESEDAQALQHAEEKLIELMNAFDYENQI